MSDFIKELEGLAARMKVALTWGKFIGPSVVRGWSEELTALLAKHAEPRKCGHKEPLLNSECLECAKAIPEERVP